MKIGVLGSGKGTNFEAILKAIQDGNLQAQVAVVLSDVADAPILEKARKAGIPAESIAPGKYCTRLEPDVEESFVRSLKNHGVEWVALAGFMRILKGPLFKAYPRRILNIHPSLLPSFPGLDSWRQAWEWGAKFTGCTVHFVDEGIDTGPIILQEAVKIEEGDSPEKVHQKIQEVEHRLYPEALQLIFEKRLEVKGRRVLIYSRGPV